MTAYPTERPTVGAFATMLEDVIDEIEASGGRVRLDSQGALWVGSDEGNLWRMVYIIDAFEPERD